MGLPALSRTQLSIAGGAVLAALVGGTALLAQIDPASLVDCVEVPQHQVAVCGLAGTTTTTAGTTTTSATTTTTQAPTTTTTVAPTTTTTVPATTTTTEGPLPVPSGPAFTFMFRGKEDNPESPQTEAGSRFWWDAPYFRNLPYEAEAHWVDGDKIAYNCIYAFITDDAGRVLGSVTFIRLNYAGVNDSMMQEGQRRITGEFRPGGQHYRPAWCSQLLTTAYTVANVPDQRPVITYEYLSGELLERRNYQPTVTGNNLTFDFIGCTDAPFVMTADDFDSNNNFQETETWTVHARCTIVAREFGASVIVGYYDSLVPEVTVVSDLAP